MISAEDLPLLELFQQLRKAGFPLGIEEYQTLLRALQAGFGISDDADELQSGSAQAELDALKRLCQTLWVKSLEDIPVFNYHFKQYMQPRRKETLAQTGVTQTKTEYGSVSPPTSETLPMQTPRPTPNPATTSELATAMPDDVEASKALALLQAASTVDEISYNPIIQTDEYLPVTRRQMKQSWRHLRRPTRQGPPTELDIEATVDDVGRQGVLFEPILVPRRINRAVLLLLIDQGGSMTPFHPLSFRLAETAVRGGRFGSVNIYYFHNCPREYLYHDSAQVKAELVKDVLDRLHHEQTGVLIFSDAGAARHKYNIERLIATMEFVEKLKQQFRYIAWLNPVPDDRWSDATAQDIRQLVPMFDISQRGLENAISVLRGHPIHAYLQQGVHTHG